jgi:hypothetical protein
MSEDNCAIGPDGKLKDASEITWFNDPDDEFPIEPLSTDISMAASSSLPASHDSSSSQTTSRVNAFSVLLSKGAKPTNTTAGSRRSTRTVKPSAKVREADASSPVSGKHPTVDTDMEDEVPTKKSRQSSLRSIVIDSDDDMTGPTKHILSRKATIDNYDDDDEVAGTDDNEDGTNADYIQTKALGDEDREVCDPILIEILSTTRAFQARRKVSKDDRTADIKTIFSCETKVNVRTGKSENIGWHCNVCR